MIIASLATIPGRERAMREAAVSLRKQVDAVFVYDNSTNPDLGDAGKFAASPESGYHIVCDDDLLYMPGYVRHMIDAIEHYERTAVVTLQGRVLHRQLNSFYNDRGGFKKYSLQANQEDDVVVDVVASGVMAYHTDTIRFSLGDFQHRNMADVNAGLVCARAKVPIVCIAHTGREVSLSKYVDHTGPETIWFEAHKNDAVQTTIANRIYALRQKVAA